MEKLQDSGILNQYNIVAIAYKHSPYFNLSWFRLCRDSADNVVNLGAKLAELLDPNAYRIVKEGPKNNIIKYKFFLIDEKDKSKLHKANEIIVNTKSMNVLNVHKKDCIYNPYVYAVAVILGYLLLPKKLKTIGILGENEVNVIKLRKFKDTGKFIIEIKNNRYQRIRLYENDFKILYEFNNKLRSLRNLKQFHCSELSELAPLALKSLKKAKKRL